MAWWDPISWVQDASSDFQKTWEAVKNWTINHVRDAANAVEHDVQDIMKIADAGLADVQEAVGTVYGWAESAYDWVENTGRDIVGDVEHYADLAVRGVENDLASAVRTVEHYADDAVSGFERDVVDPIESTLRGLITDAVNGATRLYNDVKGDLVDFETTARGWVDDATKAVEKYADDGLSIFNRDVIAPLDAFAHDVYDVAIKTTDDVWHEALAAVHLVEGAADWLALFALHALSDIENLPAEITAALSFQAVQSYLEGPGQDDIAKADSFVSQWLGV